MSKVPFGRPLGESGPMSPAMPLSPALMSSGMLFVSGQVGVDPVTGELAGLTIAIQTNRCLMNVKALVEAAGLTMDDVVKTTVFLVDMADFAAMNEAYREFFRDPLPARSTVKAALVRPEFKVEVEAIAMRPEGGFGR